MDGSGNVVELLWHTSKGPDGIYLTADDIIQPHTYEYGDGSTTPRLVDRQWSVGPDKVWGTSDDAVIYVTRRFDTYGTFHGGSGDDGLWNTEDDFIDSGYVEKQDWEGYLHYNAFLFQVLTNKCSRWTMS